MIQRHQERSRVVDDVAHRPSSDPLVRVLRKRPLRRRLLVFLAPGLRFLLGREDRQHRESEVDALRCRTERLEVPSDRLKRSLQLGELPLGGSDRFREQIPSRHIGRRLKPFLERDDSPPGLGVLGKDSGMGWLRPNDRPAISPGDEVKALAYGRLAVIAGLQLPPFGNVATVDEALLDPLQERTPLPPHARYELLIVERGVLPKVRNALVSPDHTTGPAIAFCNERTPVSEFLDVLKCHHVGPLLFRQSGVALDHPCETTSAPHLRANRLAAPSL